MPERRDIVPRLHIPDEGIAVVDRIGCHHYPFERAIVYSHNHLTERVR